MMRTMAAVLLALVWLFPHLGVLCAGVFPAQASPLMAPGVGLLDSNRSLLFGLCLASFVLSLPSKQKFSGAAPLASLFLGWTVVSSLAGGHPVDSLFFSQTWFAAALALVAGQRLIPEQLSVSLRATLIHAPAIFICIGALLPLALDAEVDRISAPFGLANIYSNWMLMILPFVLVDFFTEEGDRLFLPALSTLLCLSTLTLTYSRLGWLLGGLEVCAVLLVLGSATAARLKRWTLVVAVGVFALVLVRTWLGGVGFLLALLVLMVLPPLLEVLLYEDDSKRLLRLALVALVAAAGITAMGRLNPGNELTTVTTARMDRLVKGDNSRLSRTDFWRAAFLLSNDHPLLGTGPATFGTQYPRHQVRYYFYSDSPHNTTLELTSELGWAGGLIFVLALGIFLRGAKRDWKDEPYRKMALIALFFGLAQAQVDVTYQYASLWTTLALVCAVLTRSEQESDPPKLALGGLALVLPALLWLTVAQRQFEIGQRLVDTRAAYQTYRAVSDKIPGWSKPALRALDTGMFLGARNKDERLPLKELAPLAKRVLEVAPDDASSYRLAGVLAARAGKEEEAIPLLERSLELDPFNFPATYQALMGNPKYGPKIELMEKILTQFPIEPLESAYTSHRENLTKQLVPLFLETTQTIPLWDYPVKLEPLCRFVVDYDPKNHAAQFNLGLCLWTQKPSPEAAQHLLVAHKLAPPNKKGIRPYEATLRSFKLLLP